MKTIGLLGGMSWHSTELYYRLLNEGVQQRLGGLHSALILMSSVEFAEIARLQREGDWDRANAILAVEAARLEHAGADFLLIATNTMHIAVPSIEACCKLPILHIADATARAIFDAGLQRVGLLGTRFTMQQDYYRSRLEKAGLEVLVPDDPACQRINDVIFEELCFGQTLDDSRAFYLEEIDRLVKKGAECVIEGCTEITLLVTPEHTTVPLFDTTAIHAAAAVELALQE
jgi:aspartate racemase